MKRRNRKGFTLVELCIVIAITAIVAAMITSAILFISGQNDHIHKEAEFITEVTDARTQVNDWLSKYDRTGYVITATTTEAGQTALQATGDGTTGTITFADGKITVDGVAVSDAYRNITDITFRIQEGYSPEGDLESRVAELRIDSLQGKELHSQTLLFPLFSGNVRARNVTGK